MVAAACARGFAALRRWPALALLPLAWDTLRVWLAYNGVPLGPVAAAHPGGASVQIGLFWPSDLPSVSDLQVPLQPAGALLHSSWLSFLVWLLPIVGAAVAALYLSLVGEALQAKHGSVVRVLRRACAAWPGLVLLNLARALLPLPLWLVLMLMGVSLLPFLLAIGGQPLVAAMRATGRLWWGNIRAWLGLALVAGVTAGVVGFVLSLMHTPYFDFAFYPVVATGIVASAGALALEQMQGALLASAVNGDTQLVAARPNRWPRPLARLYLPAIGDFLVVAVWLALLVVAGRCADDWINGLPSYADLPMAVQQTLQAPYELIDQMTAGRETVVLFRGNGQPGLGVGLIRPTPWGQYRWVYGSSPTNGYRKGPISASKGYLRAQQQQADEPLVYVAAGEVFDPAVTTLDITAATGLDPTRVPVRNGHWMLVHVGQGPTSYLHITARSASGAEVSSGDY